ncbi:MAG TPA: hypothetical protein VF407_02525, partial [Polyangiaceae bacterium]
AEALALVAAEWSGAGETGREVYVIQQLDQIVGAAVNRVGQMDVATLDVVDGGDAESISALAAGFPLAVARVLQESGQAMGVDILKLIGSAAGAPIPEAPKTARGLPPPGSGNDKGGL